MIEEANPTPADEAPPALPADHEAGLDRGIEADQEAGAPEKPEIPPEQATKPVEPAVLAAPADPGTRPNFVFLAVVSVVSLALDLGSKWWAQTRLHVPGSFREPRIEVIKDVLAFHRAENTGGAWGLLGDQPESIRRPFFLVISVLAIVFIVSLYRKLAPHQWALKWGLPLVLGGALGNLINRIQLNYVVDFIDVSARWDGRPHHWPTFNVADVAIVAGVILMAVDMFTPAKKAPLAAAVAPEEKSPAGTASVDPAPIAPAPALSDGSEGGPSEPAPKET
jgi:signal peptidase II